MELLEKKYVTFCTFYLHLISHLYIPDQQSGNRFKIQRKRIWAWSSETTANSGSCILHNYAFCEQRPWMKSDTVADPGFIALRGANRVGRGNQSPTRQLFSKFACQMKKIGSHWRGRASTVPPAWIRLCDNQFPSYFLQITEMYK